MMDRQMLTYFEDALNQQLKEVVPGMRVKLIGLADMNAHHGPMDEIDQTSKRYEQELLMQMQSRSKQLIREIEEALHRLKKGDFGVCQECGGDIEVRRLKAQPMAKMCLKCKKELEFLEKLKAA
ncbi:MAG: TraR/DksA family transcriptional regulator [Syntrophobacteraceae bacterium]